jgi:hypothetical protein
MDRWRGWGLWWVDAACKWSTNLPLVALAGHESGLALAYDTNSNGSIQVGFSSHQVFDGVAYYWNSAGIHKLQDPFNIQSIAYAISPNGNYIGGYVAEDTAQNSYINAAVWDANRNLILLKDSVGNRFEGAVLDVSDLGYAVGTTASGKGFIWHPSFTEPKIFENWLEERQAGYTPQILSKGVEAISEDRINGKLRFALSDYEAPGASFYVEVDAPEIIEQKERYALWNSRLGMWNFLELINDTDTLQSVEVKLYNREGILKNSGSVDIAPQAQVDIPIHDYSGVKESDAAGGSFGIVTVKGKISGRLSYYKYLQVGNNFDFAYSIPLLTPTTGKTAVGFNTMEPSGVPVSNWFSIVNLANTPKVFHVRKYNQPGLILNPINNAIEIPAQSRVDLDGGHSIPGRNNVGLLEVTPQDSSAPYIAQLVRYGDRSAATQDFAFPLLAKTATDNIIYAPLTTLNNADNWLEIANPGDVDANVAVTFYKSDGTSNSQTVKIDPHSQKHIYANSKIGSSDTGYAQIDSDVGIISQSMVYEYEKVGGALLSMYGLQASDSYPKQASTSYNLNIGMDNFLRLNNLSDSPVNFVLKVSSLFATGATLNITLNPRESQNLDLKNTTLYGTATNTYGSVAITTTIPKQVQAYVLRKHYGDNGLLDFAAPTIAQ